MKVYKVEIMVIDFDELGRDGIVEEMENVRYPNRCLSPTVMNITERDIGEWTDDHPLNSISKAHAEYERLFGVRKESVAHYDEYLQGRFGKKGGGSE